MSTTDQRRLIALLDRHFAGVHARMDQLGEHQDRLDARLDRLDARMAWVEAALCALRRQLRAAPPAFRTDGAAVQVAGGWVHLPLRRPPGRGQA